MDLERKEGEREVDLFEASGLVWGFEGRKDSLPPLGVGRSFLQRWGVGVGGRSRRDEQCVDPLGGRRDGEF